MFSLIEPLLCVQVKIPQRLGISRFVQDIRCLHSTTDYLRLSASCSPLAISMRNGIPTYRRSSGRQKYHCSLGDFPSACHF